MKKHFDDRIEQITRLVVSKKSLSYCNDSSWEKHRSAQIAIRINGNSAEIVVDEKWTSRDIECVVGLMGVFRKTLHNVIIDAPIAELLIVSLSPLDLQRWYAFQCYMKVHNVFDDVEDEEQHVIVAGTSANPTEVYWPNVESLTVKTTRQQSPHLARILDYGVVVNHVLNRRQLSHIKVIYTDVQQNFKALARNVFPFRCWAGSAGFDHRFDQEFAGKTLKSL
ncbi:unnamed protein product, partial [Mesorhabditis belari]|uniref:Uncharacterized protein n=1 Tax=Mesorhabditis belari TaxID=2138241 RepID=A0AAF3ESW0_9BILA